LAILAYIKIARKKKRVHFKDFLGIRFLPAGFDPLGGGWVIIKEEFYYCAWLGV